MIWELWYFEILLAPQQLLSPRPACVHASKVKQNKWRAASGQLQVDARGVADITFPVPAPVDCEQGDQGGLQAVWLEVD